MDIRKLQRAIVDGLEDTKAQNILVFNTEHLSALFERVIVASGTSNRQTKALAASVRDAVRVAGFPVLATEGADNGEWIIVDCGAAVAHIMQPSIREYYRLEEIWGGKAVKMKLGSVSTGLVKASEVPVGPLAKAALAAPAIQRSAAKKPAAKAVGSKPVAAKSVVAKKAGPRKPASASAGRPGRGTPVRQAASKTIVVKPALKAKVKPTAKPSAKSSTKPNAKPRAAAGAAPARKRAPSGRG